MFGMKEVVLMVNIVTTTEVILKRGLSEIFPRFCGHQNIAGYCTSFTDRQIEAEL